MGNGFIFEMHHHKYWWRRLLFTRQKWEIGYQKCQFCRSAKKVKRAPSGLMFCKKHWPYYHLFAVNRG